MISTIYIEDAVRDHPRVTDICARFPDAPRIGCARYGEVFNPKAQNFRLQKNRPSLILANKFDGHVLPTPDGYSLGGTRNFYFSHMLNCLYDCRYCFLQGMYRSAHYVVFVNYEDFLGAIDNQLAAAAGEDTWFFSGYDCDSLAAEPITGFSDFFLPFFRERNNAWLELRTKSTQVRSLLKQESFDRCIVAFSFTPDEIARAVEHKAPTVERRIEAMVKLQEAGWKLGLRFDPLIYQQGYANQYEHLFEQVFSRLRVDALHSVSLGPFRMPEGYFRSLVKLYPREPLFASRLEKVDGMMSYERELEQEMTEYCTTALLAHIPGELLFPCTWQ